MTFDALWQEIEKQNPNLKTEQEVTLKVRGFKKAVRLGYEHGLRQHPVMSQLFERFKVGKSC